MNKNRGAYVPRAGTNPDATHRTSGFGASNPMATKGAYVPRAGTNPDAAHRTSGFGASNPMAANRDARADSLTKKDDGGRGL